MIYKTTNFEMVGDFMSACDQEVKDIPEFPDSDIIELRKALMKEEWFELLDAIEARDLVGVADALTDILYVVYGAGHAFGIDLDACFEEVHESNMSKLGDDGYAIKNEFGKVMKGPNYFEPDLARLLELD
jgi:predicted HAD superfamily Cof-like phosphohydrolase